MKGYQKLELIGDIELQEETSAMRKAAASIIDLPTEKKQQDLQYFSALYVSTGTNLNFAHFMGSEIVAAKDTISSKALDIEHTEDEIIGHLYDYAFMDMAGNKVEIEELAAMSKIDLDEKEFHVVIAGVIYKNRFPEIAEEVKSGEWKVSMEAYYQKYDVKIGNLIISLDEAKALGLTEDSSMLGKAAKVIKKGKEIAQGNIARVLRNVMFSGCGIVKNPANPPSVILETAHKLKIDATDDGDIIILSYDAPEEASVDKTDDSDKKEDSEITRDDTLGICVSYKKEVIDSTFKDQDSNVVRSNWCTLYDQGCTSFSRDTSDPDCLRTIEITKVAEASIQDFIGRKEASDQRKNLVSKLNASLDKAAKLI